MKCWPALDIRFASPERQDLVQAALLDYEVAAVDEGTSPSPSAWRVFFHSPESRDAAGAALSTLFPGDLSTTAVDVPDEDWATRSQANLRAVSIGHIIVAPPWNVPESGGRRKEKGERVSLAPDTLPPSSYLLPPDQQRIVIVIRPSMGFGTGHHATTRLCLDALQHLDLAGRTVLDVGTGSGVLAIAASRFGASQVLAVDDDVDAIESARDNLGLNPGVNVTLGHFDVRRATLRPFDVVLANLTGGLLVDAGGRLQELASKRLVLSGFTESEEQQVLDPFSDWTIEQRTQEHEWVCVVLRRQKTEDRT